MKLAIMQPYLFPYIGYFQLLNSADVFLIYDDVQFIKEGWINRNRILFNGQSLAFTLPLMKASHKSPINARAIAENRWNKERKKLLAAISQGYRKAPYFEQAMATIKTSLEYETPWLTPFIMNALQSCCDYLGLETKIALSSKQRIAENMSGQDRVIAICKALGSDHYINAIGGKRLYDKTKFSSHGIKLSFIQTQDINYRQFNQDFVPWLSIIDVMMFNPPDKIHEYLQKYELV